MLSLNEDVGTAALVILELGKISTYRLDSCKQWSVGRKTPINSPDIELCSNIAGRQQGKLTYIGENWFWINGKSRNGTYYNRKKIVEERNGSIRPILLNEGDVLEIDSADFNSSDSVWIMFSTRYIDEKWTFYHLENRKEIVIGKNPKQCGIVLVDSNVSEKHAKITHLNGVDYLVDCKSDLGTWVNGKRIVTSVILNEKDIIKIGDSLFIYAGGKLIYNRKSN